MDMGYTIDDLIATLAGLKALHGNVEVTILQCTDEDEYGNVEYWDAHICNVKMAQSHKDGKDIVSVY